MPTHQEEEVAGLRRKSAEIVRDGLEIRSAIIEGEARESESWGSSPLIVSTNEEETGFDEEFAEDFMQGLLLEPIEQEHEEEDEEEEEFEFACVCENPDESLISAEEAFHDGRIKPFYPVFGRNIFLDEDASQSSSSSSSSSVLRGILVEERVGNPSSSSSSSSLDGGDPLEGLAEGTYCVWRTGRAGKAGEGVKGVCRKSNSTGFSKLWRVKDLVMRSNSDGKDAFVFLNPKKAKENTLTATTTIAAAQTKSTAKSNGCKAKAVSVAVRKNGHHNNEYHFRNDKNRRRSYLPYKVGFFTNIDGMTRNVHPY